METRYFMNKYTGSVDTEQNWTADGFAPDKTPSLIEVVKDPNGVKDANGDRWREVENAKTR